MILPDIRYKIPKGETANPFDINSDKKFFINASGYTYATNDISQFQHLYNNQLIIENIPVGYKAIVVYEKLNIMHKGDIIKSFPPLDEEIINSMFYRVINKFLVMSINLFDDENNDPQFVSPIESRNFADQMWDEIESALAATAEESCVNEQYYFINRVLAWQNWH